MYSPWDPATGYSCTRSDEQDDDALPCISLSRCLRWGIISLTWAGCLAFGHYRSPKVLLARWYSEIWWNTANNSMDRSLRPPFGFASSQAPAPSRKGPGNEEPKPVDGPGNEVEISRGLRCHFVYEVRSFGVYISSDELIYRSKTLTNWTLEKAATYGRHMEMHCSGELEVIFLTNHSVLIDPNCALNDTWSALWCTHVSSLDINTKIPGKQFDGHRGHTKSITSVFTWFHKKLLLVVLYLLIIKSLASKRVGMSLAWK